MLRYFLLLLLSFPLFIFAQKAKDGNRIVSSFGTVVNDYTVLTSDILAGDLVINVQNSALNANFSVPLQAGDLLFIIQMQGAAIKGSAIASGFGMQGSPIDSTWGEVINYNNAGNNEFVVVDEVINSTQVSLQCAITKNYTASGKVQVIRVPRYLSLNINNNASITAPAWNGSTGGVVALEVSENTFIEAGGRITATGLGFRGGAKDNLTDWNAPEIAADNPRRGAEKGEGIAGYQNDYNPFGGRYCRGAAANGGGGGNGFTSGGGGGANAGNLNIWTGRGIPDTTVLQWKQAWNLEYNGFANSTNSGGGRGGYSFSGSNGNALTQGPGNSAWGGDNRRNNGGLGGRPLDYSDGRLFLGGGGGAGDMDDNQGGAGGNGGGMVIILSYKNILGDGEIVSNGSNGGNAQGTAPTNSFAGKDGAGGAGAGGTIILKASGTISGISLSTNGGNGGNQILTRGGLYFGSLNEAEGPGGGGSGGFIAISSGNPLRTANGGNNGTTNSDGLTEFTPNGATKGAEGLALETIDAEPVILASDTSICSPASITLSATVFGNIPIGSQLFWWDSPVGGNIVGSGNSFTTPVIDSTTVFYVGFCPGVSRDSVVVTLSPLQVDAGPDVSICEGSSLQLNATGGVNYSWTPSTALSDAQIQNPVASPTQNITYYVTVDDGNNCSAIDSVSITVNTFLSFNITPDTLICYGDTITLNISGLGNVSYNWNASTTLSDTQIPNPLAFPLIDTWYFVEVTDTASGCSGTDSVLVTVNPQLSLTAGNNQTICSGQPVNISASASGGNGTLNYIWNEGLGNNSSHTVSPQASVEYIVYVEDGFGCKSSADTVFIDLFSQPTVNLTTDKDSVCPGEQFLLSASTGGGDGNYSYSWNPGTSFSELFPTSSNSSGNYTITVSDGCNNSVQDSVFITVAPDADADFILSYSGNCEPLEVLYSAIEPNNSIYYWEFGDGTISNTSDGIKIYSSGMYYVQLTVTSQYGCTATYTAISPVIVDPNPIADFSYNPSSGISPVTPVQFNYQLQDNETVLWNFDGEDSSMIPAPIHVFDSAGEHNVMLIVYNSFGCSDTLIKTIKVEDELLIPNVFSPNGDGVNDKLVIKGPPGTLNIFNRWGNLLFASDNYDNSWKADGVPEGTYYYVYSAGEKQYSGHITIVR
jgi:gliding motility-associated-like protein